VVLTSNSVALRRISDTGSSLPAHGMRGPESKILKNRNAYSLKGAR